MRNKAIWTAFAILCLTAPASAEDCKPLQYITGVPIVVSNMVMMPVTLGQKTVTMIFDSGGTANQLTRSTVKDLKLVQEDSPIRLLDESGNESSTFVTVDRVNWGGLKLSNMEFQVTTLDFLDTEHVAGLISNSVLNAVDVDLDFGSGRLNIFSPSHCPGKVVYWPATAVAAVPTGRNSSNQIVVPVQIDGHAMQAVIDTGQTYTTMNMQDAKSKFGLQPGTPDMVELNGNINGDKKLSTYRHRFTSLSFEGITVQNPSTLIIPDRVNSQQGALTGSQLRDPDLKLPELIIGLDILKSLHVYFSYRERMLYITPADDKAGKLLPAVAGLPVDPAPANTPK